MEAVLKIKWFYIVYFLIKNMMGELLRLVVKDSSVNAGDMGTIPRLGRFCVPWTAKPKSCNQ